MEFFNDLRSKQSSNTSTTPSVPNTHIIIDSSAIQPLLHNNTPIVPIVPELTVTQIFEKAKTTTTRYSHIELYELNNIPKNIEHKYIIGEIKGDKVEFTKPQKWANLDGDNLATNFLKYIQQNLNNESQSKEILVGDVTIDDILIKYKNNINSNTYKYYKLVELTNIIPEPQIPVGGGDLAISNQIMRRPLTSQEELYLLSDNYTIKRLLKNKNKTNVTKNRMDNNFIKYYLSPILLFKFSRISLFKYLYKFENDFIIKKILVDLFISLSIIFILYTIGLYKIAILLFNDLLISFIFIYLYIYYSDNYEKTDTEEEKNKKLNIIYILILIPYFLIKF